METLVLVVLGALVGALATGSVAIGIRALLFSRERARKLKTAWFARARKSRKRPAASARPANVLVVGPRNSLLVGPRVTPARTPMVVGPRNTVAAPSLIVGPRANAVAVSREYAPMTGVLDRIATAFQGTGPVRKVTRRVEVPIHQALASRGWVRADAGVGARWNVIVLEFLLLRLNPYLKSQGFYDHLIRSPVVDAWYAGRLEGRGSTFEGFVVQVSRRFFLFMMKPPVEALTGYHAACFVRVKGELWYVNIGFRPNNHAIPHIDAANRYLEEVGV